jgi:hypothetical protein
MRPDPLTLDLFGTFPNAMFRKVLPIFMGPDPLSTGAYGTVLILIRRSARFQYLCVRIHYLLMYMVPTYPYAMFRKALPIEMFRRVLPIPDPLSTDVYGTYSTLYGTYLKELF